MYYYIIQLGLIQLGHVRAGISFTTTNNVTNKNILEYDHTYFFISHCCFHATVAKFCDWHSDISFQKLCVFVGFKQQYNHQPQSNCKGTNIQKWSFVTQTKSLKLGCPGERGMLLNSFLKITELKVLRNDTSILLIIFSSKSNHKNVTIFLLRRKMKPNHLYRRKTWIFVKNCIKYCRQIIYAIQRVLTTFLNYWVSNDLTWKDKHKQKFTIRL